MLKGICKWCFSFKIRVKKMQIMEQFYLHDFNGVFQFKLGPWMSNKLWDEISDTI